VRKSKRGRPRKSNIGNGKDQSGDREADFRSCSSIDHVQVYPILPVGKNSHVPHPPPLSLLICQSLWRHLLLLIAMPLLWMIHGVDHCEDKALCGNIIDVAANFGLLLWVPATEGEHCAIDIKT